MERDFQKAISIFVNQNSYFKVLGLKFQGWIINLMGFQNLEQFWLNFKVFKVAHEPCSYKN